MRACRVREGEKDGERSDHQREDILEKVKAFEKKVKYFFTQRRPTIKIQRMHFICAAHTVPENAFRITNPAILMSFLEK